MAQVTVKQGKESFSKHCDGSDLDLRRVSRKARTIQCVAHVRGRGKVQMDFATEGQTNNKWWLSWLSGRRINRRGLVTLGIS